MANNKVPGYGTLRAGLNEVGSSGAPFYWDRGYVPHIESHLLIQHVCYHLADSLPREVVDGMWAELEETPPSLRNAEMEKRAMAYMDAGHGSCVLREPELAEVVQDTFLVFHGKRYTLHAWCVMPNHVHVLFQPLEGWTMSRIVASWKSYTGRRISEWRQANSPVGLGPGGPKGDPNRVWQRGYFDRYIRNAGHYANVVEYIHENPVKSGLVGRAEDWPHSSVGVVPEWSGIGYGSIEE